MTSSHKVLVINHNKMVANNTVALSHIFELNKNQICMFSIRTVDKEGV